MKYGLIAHHTAAFAVAATCHALEVSVSGWYAWRPRAQVGPSARAQADTTVSARIRAAFVAGRGVYGSPRVHAARRMQGLRCGRKRVARPLRAQGLRAGRVRRCTPRTTDSRHAQPVAPNRPGRDFTAPAPNRKRVADITAVATRSGWPSLAGILDVYSRRAIG